MGLDQYGYAVKGDDKRELMYWRKHPNLHGFMDELWESKDRPVPDGIEVDDSPMGSFNCIPLSLTMGDLEELEECVRGNKLPHTYGFFFGESREEHDEATLEFINKAKQALLDGYEVYYDSWW
jgi:hypothetical protein